MPVQTIGLLLYPGCMPAGLFAFADLLQAANQRLGARRFDTCWVGPSLDRVECAHGMSLQPDRVLEPLDCTALLVPGLWADSAPGMADALQRHRGLIAALGRQPRSLQLWSYCTGVALLAASGRLDGESATATWWLADSLQKRFARVDWQFQRTHVFNPRTATASGVSGHLPIARALLERELGEAMHRDIAQAMVLPRPARAAPVFRSLGLLDQADPLLRSLFRVVERLPARQLGVTRLAAELCLSPRTLARRIKALTGTGVADYAGLVKLNQASERLILTGEPVPRISEALGFGDESGFRRAFKRVTGLTPTAYRQQYGL